MLFFSSEKATEPPKRSSREKCWESRDLFFACLDKENIVNPLDPAHRKTISKQCGNEDKEFHKDCVASWVKYFKEKRPFDIKKERMLKEAENSGNEIVQMPGYRK